MAYFDEELQRLDAKVTAYEKLKAGFEAELQHLQPEVRRLAWRAMEGRANAADELRQVETRMAELQTAISRVPQALEQGAAMRTAWLQRQGEFATLQQEFDTLQAQRPALLQQIDTLTGKLEKAVEEYLAHNTKLTAAADRVQDRLAVTLRKAANRLYIYLSWKLLRFDNRTERTTASGVFRRSSLTEIEAGTLAPEAPAAAEPATESVLAER